MSEKLGNSTKLSEVENNLDLLSEEKKEVYPAFNGKDYESTANTEKTLSVEEAKDKVIQLFDKKEEKSEMQSETDEAYKKAREELLKSIPDDPSEALSWVERVDKFPEVFNGREQDSHVYTGSDHERLSEKHGGSILSEDREEIYKILREDFEDGRKYHDMYQAKRLMINAFKNIERIREDTSGNQYDKAKSIEIEEKAAEYFAEKAAELGPNIGEHALREYAFGISSIASTYGTMERLTNEYHEAKSAKEKEKIKAYAQKVKDASKLTHGRFPVPDAGRVAQIYDDKASEVYDAIRDEEYLNDPEMSGKRDSQIVSEVKLLKLLFEEATRQREEIRGFSNKRKLKKDEKLDLPESFAKMVNKEAYTPQYLLRLIGDYIGMQM